MLKWPSEQKIAAYVDHDSDYGCWKSVRRVCEGKHRDAACGSSCNDLMASQAYYSLSTSACVFTTEGALTGACMCRRREREVAGAEKAEVQV